MYLLTDNGIKKCFLILKCLYPYFIASLLAFTIVAVELLQIFELVANVLKRSS